ncbi:hypothetical protein SSPS47_25225 [Streptomyces sp. S4.7]|nr:hypothetical protein SSPS47_25225 [Streptomyces sp. S4.7]
MNALRRGANDPQAKVELIEAADDGVHNRLDCCAEDLDTNGPPSTPSRFLDQLWDTLARILQEPIGLLSLQAKLIIVVRQQMLAVRPLARLQVLASAVESSALSRAPVTQLTVEVIPSSSGSLPGSYEPPEGLTLIFPDRPAPARATGLALQQHYIINAGDLLRRRHISLLLRARDKRMIQLVQWSRYRRKIKVKVLLHATQSRTKARPGHVLTDSAQAAPTRRRSSIDAPVSRARYAPSLPSRRSKEALMSSRARRSPAVGSPIPFESSTRRARVRSRTCGSIRVVMR